jgi:hypothetical protein
MTGLPSPEDVFVIAVAPHSQEMKDYFTPESLLQALPKLVPADVTIPVGGKQWCQSDPAIESKVTYREGESVARLGSRRHGCRLKV